MGARTEESSVERGERRAAAMILWIIPLVAAYIYCHETTEPDNVTTLYPTNKTIIKKYEDNEIRENIGTKLKYEATAWKLETAYAEPNLTESDSRSKEVVLIDKSEDKPENRSEFRPNFKPSVHLGTIEDVELDYAPTQSTGSFTPVMKNPPTSFKSSFKDSYQSKNPSKDLLKYPNYFPYKYESPTHTEAKSGWHNLESRPTEQVRASIPAGGLYQFADAFKGKPVEESPEEFSLSYNEDDRETRIKKRGNPWNHIIHLAAALIPVGLIVSALTPQVVTLKANANDQLKLGSNLFRRSDTSGAGAGPTYISERCRRRLLCELRSDKNYHKYSRAWSANGLDAAGGAGAQCSRIYCEDPAGLAASLRWLLTYHLHHPQP